MKDELLAGVYEVCNFDIWNVVGVEKNFACGGDTFAFIGCSPSVITNEEELFLGAEVEAGEFIVPIFGMVEDCAVDADGFAFHLRGDLGPEEAGGFWGRGFGRLDGGDDGCFWGGDGLAVGWVEVDEGHDEGVFDPAVGEEGEEAEGNGTQDGGEGEIEFWAGLFQAMSDIGENEGKDADAVICDKEGEVAIGEEDVKGEKCVGERENDQGKNSVDPAEEEGDNIERVEQCENTADDGG